MFKQLYVCVFAVVLHTDPSGQEAGVQEVQVSGDRGDRTRGV